MIDFELRPLRWTDWLFARRLAADPVTRAMSHDPTPPRFSQHWRWMRGHLTRGTAWVITYGELLPVAIGQVKRGEPDTLWIGITVAPEFRGRGFAAGAINLVTAAALRHWPNEAAVYAAIKPENAASRRAFARAGYVPTSATDTYVYLRRDA